MKVLILGLNYAPEKVGIAVYSTGMAEALAAKGHDVRFVAAQPYYPAWKIMEGHRAGAYRSVVINGVKITHVPHYIPARPTGTRRLIHHLSFLVTSIPSMIKAALLFRPDVVLTVAPSLIASPAAKIAALMCGAKTWLHLQDFEVEAALATGLLESGSFAKLALGFEKLILRRFDRVSSISPQMCRKLREKGIPDEAIYEFRNWANIAAVMPLERASTYRETWGIVTPHVVLYSGNIANKQGIDIVVSAARRLAHRPDLTFVICGEGPNRANLEASAAGLSNIRFFDLQPKEKLNDLMGLATIHLLPQLSGAADLVLPSKLTNMLASGRPVITTAPPDSGLALEVEGCGLVTTPEDSAEMANSIETLIDDQQLYAGLATAARKRAEQRWSGEQILSQFNGALLSLIDKAGPTKLATDELPINR